MFRAERLRVLAPQGVSCYVADPDDPERARLETLVERVAAAEATEAEAVELRLYAEADPEVSSALARAQDEAQLAEGWLTRLEADRQIQRVATAPLARIERGAGLTMFLGGSVLLWVVPVLGAGLLTGGLVALTYSFLRVRLKTHRQDPYRKVEK